MSPVNVLVTVLTRDRDSPRVARTQGIGAIVNLYDFSSRYCSPRGSPSPSLPLSSPKIPPGNFQRRWWGGGDGGKNRSQREGNGASVPLESSQRNAYIATHALSHCAIAKISRTDQSNHCVRHFAERTFHMHEDSRTRVSAFSRQVIIIRGRVP